MARLKDYYRNEVVPALVKQFGYASVMQVPRIEKIVLNMGVGEATGDKQLLENAVGDMPRSPGRSRWSPSRPSPSPDSRSARAIRSAAW
jgi:large subunit ribosomal protein L5